MKKVYVAGAYSGNNAIDVLKNIGRGEKEAAKLFLLGYAPFCPWHDRDFITRFPEQNFRVEQFRGYCMEWLKVSDAVYIVPNMDGLTDWSKSKGTIAEIEMANEHGIPVFFSLEELQNRFPINVDTTEFFG